MRILGKNPQTPCGKAYFAPSFHNPHVEKHASFSTEHTRSILRSDTYLTRKSNIESLKSPFHNASTAYPSFLHILNRIYITKNANMTSIFRLSTLSTASMITTSGTVSILCIVGILCPRVRANQKRKRPADKKATSASSLYHHKRPVSPIFLPYRRPMSRTDISKKSSKGDCHENCIL